MPFLDDDDFIDDENDENFSMMMTTLKIPCRSSVCSERAGRWRGWNSSHIQVGFGQHDDQHADLRNSIGQDEDQHEHDDAADHDEE